MSGFDDGPPAVSVFGEVPPGRLRAHLAVIGGGSALVFGGLLFVEPWAWAGMAAGGAGLAVAVGEPARWAVARALRWLDDGALPGACALAFGAAGVLWGTGAQALAGAGLDAGATQAWGLGPWAWDLARTLPWEIGAGLGFAAWGWLHGTSARERWPTWDVALLGIVAVVGSFVPPALGWVVLRTLYAVLVGPGPFPD